MARNKRDREIGRMLNDNNVPDDVKDRIIREEAAKVRKGWDDQRYRKSLGQSDKPFEFPTVKTANIGENVLNFILRESRVP